MGCDLGFKTRFWIFTTELFVIMNSFMIIERNKNQWIYQWNMWHSNNMKVILLRIIVYKLFEYWTMLIVFLFLILTLFIWLTIKLNNLRKCYRRISKKHDQTFIFVEGVIYNQSCLSICVCLSVCLSVRLWDIFL